MIDQNILEEIVVKLIAEKARTRDDFRKFAGAVLSEKNQSGYVSNIDLRETYDRMLENGDIDENEDVEKLLMTKKMRSLSGVSVITVLTKPYDCPGKCIYCPTEQDVPKSYLSDEPAVMRAILNDFDPQKQVETRLKSLKKQGHPVDKIELIVIGGTFNYLPKEYQEEYIKSCFDGLNGVVSKTLDEAKNINEKAISRCVGLTLETRPDYINKEEVEWFRYLGATRVELGVQSVFDDVLEKNARGHKASETILATKLLKNAGFKINYHLMPNLYGSNFELDKKMFDIVFDDSVYRPDYIKIYPCMVMKDTPLFELFKKGEYHSYSNKELIELIKYAKMTVPGWIRIMRTIRDIPAKNIISGSVLSNLRQIVLELAKKEGWSCGCIRCREIGSGDDKVDLKLFVEEYEASGGREFFLSYESHDKKSLFSLLRLRLTNEQTIREIKGCALIREIHTYGKQAKVGEKGETQHKGLGKSLIEEAEKIAKNAGYKKIAVISGVGVRDYYRKSGYDLVGEYMIKML